MGNRRRELFECDEEEWWEYFLTRNLKRIPDGETFKSGDACIVVQGNELVLNGVPYDVPTILSKLGELPEYTQSLLSEIINYFSEDEETRDVMFCKVSDTITIETLADGEITINGEFVTKNFLFYNHTIEGIFAYLGVPTYLYQERKRDMFKYLTGIKDEKVTDLEFLKALGLCRRQIKNKNLRTTVWDFGDKETVETIEGYLKEGHPVTVGDTTIVRKDGKVCVGRHEFSSIIPDVFSIFPEKKVLELIAGIVSEGVRAEGDEYYALRKRLRNLNEMLEKCDEGDNYKRKELLRDVAEVNRRLSEIGGK